MTWLGIASVLLASTAINHLGLISAIERIIRHKLPVFNCSKCLTFWATLAYCLACSVDTEFAVLLAISFLNAYLAIWLELGMGFIDTLYYRIYEKIYTTDKDNETTADADESSPAGGLS